MGKPTPGPWRVLADEQIMGRPISGRWAVEADGAYICLDPEWDDECYAESFANARLIAAAPELLEALELADAMLRGANMNTKRVERKVRSAIAKAKGASA